MKKHYFIRKYIAGALAWAILVTPIAVLGQTKINLPKNKYKVEQDVAIGEKASREVEQQFPILNDSQVTPYVQRVGAKLVSAIPAEFRQPAFDYSFKVVNASDINAFALPGGPMYVNRGMIEAARNEGEMAGVMAHEISHVALRHATAQQTKLNNPWNQVLGIGAVLGGAILGGQAGAAAGQIFAAGYFLRYSREYETQADYLGARIMADAGYDPRDLANMFQTIAGKGGNRGPEWLSSHPDPGNRYQKINAEAERLNVSREPIKMTRDFERAQARLRSMPPAQTMAQIQQKAEQQGQSPMGGGRYSNNVPLPSAQFRIYTGGSWLRMSVPNNWREFGGRTDITFAPEGAYGDNGITHGSMIGVFRGSSNDLYRNSQEFVQGLLQSNNYLRQQGTQNTRVAGRQAVQTLLSGRSPINGRTEVVTIYVTQLRNGESFYFAAVSPQDESSRYSSTFRTMLSSIRLSDSAL